MKRRALSLALILALAITLLAGCSGKDDNKEENIDLAAFYASLAENRESFSSHAVIEGEAKTNFYPGLDDMALTQEVLYSPMMTGIVSEIALVEVTEESAVDTVKDIFQTRIDTQVDGGAWYPASIQTWIDHAQIVSHGKYVMLIADSDSDAIVEAFYALFGEEAPTPTPSPTDITPVGTPAPTETGSPDGTGAPTETVPAVGTTPIQTEPSPSPKPSASPKPSPSPKPSASPQPSPSPSPSPTPSSVSLSGFYSSVTSSHEFPSLTLADNAIIDNYYAGLSGIGTEQCLVYVNMMSMNMGEIVLVQVTNSDDVSAVKSILQNRINYMVGDGNGPGGAWYPMATDQWENASRVVSNGNYVMMVVHEDCDSIVSSFNALFS